MRLKLGGFSLVELVVGAGILAGIGLLGTQLIKNQKSSQQLIDHDLELELLHTKISDFFREDAKNCDATFRYHYNLPGPIPAPPDLRRCTANCAVSSILTDAQSATGVAVFGVGSSLGERALWEIESFGQLTVNQLGASSDRTNIMLLPINYIHTTKDNLTRTKLVPIAMRFDSAGRFKQCVDASTTNIQNLERAMCSALNSAGGNSRGVWDGENQKCISTSTIPAGDCIFGVYVRGIEKTNGTRCVRMRDFATSPPEVNAQNVFNRFVGPHLHSYHVEVCNFNDPFAPNSFPRLYTDSNNRLVIRCGP